MSKNSQSLAITAPRAKLGALEAVILRMEFYRDKFRLMASTLPVLVVALLASISLNFYQATRKPVERYFTVDSAGRLTKIVALTEPYVTDAFIASWVSDKVARAYSIDPQNYRRQVGDLEPFFTAEGHDQYVASLQSSGTIDLITKKLLVMTGVPTGAPVVVDHGVADGVFFWKVQVPVLVSYRSSTQSAQKNRIVEVTVVRRQTMESPEGIGISQFVASDS